MESARKCGIAERRVNNELEWMWKEVAVVEHEVYLSDVPAATSEYRDDNPQSAQAVPWPTV